MHGDDSFAHLAELVDRLPKMQEADARLRRARAAENALRAWRESQACRAMLAQADAVLARQRAALREAEEACDEKAADHLRREVLYWSQQRGLRVGPAQNARAAYEEALSSGPFEGLDEARAAVLPARGHAEIEHELREYREDYAATLELCERLER